jgi:hypothetical protein
VGVFDTNVDRDPGLAVLLDLRQPLTYQCWFNYFFEGHAVGKRGPQVILDTRANPNNKAS